MISFIKYSPATTYGQGQMSEMHRVANPNVFPIEFREERSLAPAPHGSQLLSLEMNQFEQGKQPLPWSLQSLFVFTELIAPHKPRACKLNESIASQAE
jgi:hypothetical protein